MNNEKNFRRDNISAGQRKFFEEKFEDRLLAAKFVKTVNHFTKFFVDYYKNLPINSIAIIVDRSYATGYVEGYNQRKNEELTEFILTQSYNRISKN